MSERPDIGRMIDEELAGMETPDEPPGSKPIAEGDIQDLRTPAERMADRRRAKETPHEDEGQPEAKAPVPDSETKEAETALERERKQLEQEFGTLREKVLAGSDDENAAKALETEKAAMIRKIVEFASRGDANLSTNILKEGVAVSTERTTHIFGEGLRSVTDKILGQQDFRGQLESLLKLQPDAETAIKALTKHLDKRVERIAKATEQKMRLHAAPAEKAAGAAPAKKDAKTATGEAMKPFFDDVRKLARRPSAERRSGQEPKKKPGFWDRLFGKKAA